MPAGVHSYTSGPYWFAFTISINSGLSDAPPTKNPSISGFLASSAALEPFTDPVWWD